MGLLCLVAAAVQIAVIYVQRSWRKKLSSDDCFLMTSLLLNFHAPWARLSYPLCVIEAPLPA